MTMEELLAREAIRKTMARYNSAGDRGQIDEMVKAFAEDGVLETELGRCEGRAAIKEFMNSRAAIGRANSPTAGRERHFLSTSQVEFSGDGDTRAWTYFHVLQSGSTLESGIYIDRYRKSGADWLIAERRVKIEWTRRAD